MNTKIDHLNQKKIIGKRSFLLVEDGVFINQREWFSSQKYKVLFDVMDNSKVETTIYSKGWLIATILFLGLCLINVGELFFGRKADAIEALLFFGIFSFLSAVVLFLSFRRVLVYGGQYEPLVFYANNPSKEKLNSFLTELERRRNAYLLGKYAYGQRSFSRADELSKLAWLKEQGVLTAEEFEKLKQRTIDDTDMRWYESDNEEG